MPEYRRWYVPGGTFFFTAVTLDRRPLFGTELARRCFREAFVKVQKDWPFELLAIVLLPEHLHARQCRQERGVWQRRYWEHAVRDEADLKRCVDYVHWNPLKHGHVTSVCDWRWSSFHRFVRLGEYAHDWGVEDPTPKYNAPEWGE